MFRIWVRGRDGQEVLTTARLLAAAAAADGRRAVASAVAMAPGEAPGEAVCVLAEPAAIPGGQEPPAGADALIVHDPGELAHLDVLMRLPPEAYILVNSTCGFGDLGVGGVMQRFCRDRALIVPAARLDLGLNDWHVCSAIMAGGFAALSRAVSLDGIVCAVRQTMPASAAWASEDTAVAAYEFVQAEKEALAA